MWTELQNSAMMGLQATATKRKFEIGACGNAGDVQANCTPAKASRWSTTTTTMQQSTISTTATLQTTKTTTETTATINSNSINSINNNNNNNNINSNKIDNVIEADNNNLIAIPSAEESIAKLEAVSVINGNDPWNAEPIVDSISRLQAVAVPDTWGSDSSRSALATTILNADDLEDDDEDFEDEFDEEDSIIPSYSPLRYPCSPPPPQHPQQSSHQRCYMPPGYQKPNYYSEPYPQQNCSRTPNQYARPNGHYGWNNHHGYYVPPEAVSPQQTIRCAENGKSYLELGSGSYGNISNSNNSGVDPRHPKRCCDGRSNWCNNKQCYRDRRLKMRNLSMYKLSRFRQVSEQSLYRSVLICNTLKCIDREMEKESKESQAAAAAAAAAIQTNSFHRNHYNNNNSNNNNNINSRLCNSNNNNNNSNNSNNNMNSASPQELQQISSQPPLPNQYSSSDNSNSNFIQQPYNSNSNTTTTNSRTLLPTNITTAVATATTTTSSSMSFNETVPPYDHHPLRDSSSGRATPFPATNLPDSDSGYGDDDCTRSINWGSVLSLSSQSALDPLNNNDLFTPSTSIGFITTATATTTTTAAATLNATTTNWEYNLLDMDLGLGPELTELLPSWKLTPLSADDILKSVPPPMEPSKVMLLDNEMDTLTHIMVGS